MGLSTFTISKSLEAKGFTAGQAEGIAEAVVESVESEKKDLVTKEYLKSEMTIFESRLETQMVALEIRMIQWMVVSMYFLLKYFLKTLVPEDCLFLLTVP
jgi:hypothetical protein